MNYLRDADIIPAPNYEGQANKDVGDKAINLHTHGLIVKPRSYGPCGSVGDSIFTQADWKNVARYRIDIPKRIRGAFLNAPKNDPDNDPGHDDGPYPAGPYWFHAHVHGFAKPDVLSGQSGFLSVDCPTGASAAACPNSPAHLHAEEQVMALRDIQVLAPQGQTPDVLPPLLNPLPPNAAETAYYDRSIDYDPALCASLTTDLPTLDLTQLQPGFCVASSPNPDFVVSQVNGVDVWLPAANATGPATSVVGVWLFTINGQLYPNLTLTQEKPRQLWRIANISAVATYRLKLLDERSIPQKELKVVSIDGVLAGSPSGRPGDFTLGQTTDELVLMPGSRAEVLVERPETQTDRIWRLVTVGFDTGGDVWPPVALATVTMKGAPPRAAMLAAALPPSFTRKTPASTPASGPTPANCLELPAQGYRTIRFAQDQANFMIGPVVGPAASPDFSYVRSFRHDFPPGVGPHVCVRLGAVETWVLENDTDELHNFHIHQSKFRLATVSEVLGKEIANGPIYDPTNKLAKASPGLAAALTAETQDANADTVWHDTVPVPPRLDANTPGHAVVVIPFTDENQIGTFVYHCHILEHEDGGMMAAIQVYDPAHPALGSADPKGDTRLGALGSFCGIPPAGYTPLPTRPEAVGWAARVRSDVGRWIGL